MNYTEAMKYLEEVSHAGSKLGLESISELLRRLGHPENKLKFIHVGGTNGKGSTSSYVTSILVEAGYQVGRFLSPVVVTYEECIQVARKGRDGAEQYITKDQVAKHLTTIKSVCDQMVKDGAGQPTQFEIETVMAFLEFVEQQVDVVVLEVGLGGRLDATNVIGTVMCSIITSISMDHMQFLGGSLEEIAYEKAGIIKQGVPVVSYDQPNEVRDVIQAVCKEKESSLAMLSNKEVAIEEMALSGTKFYCEGQEYQVTLLGIHQVYNAYVAIRAARVLQEQGFSINDEQIRRGLKNAKWFGRFSVLESDPYIIVDGAHNEDAATMLRAAVECYFPNKYGIFVIGAFADKEYEKIIEIMAPYAKKILTVTTHSDRALPSDKLKAAADKYCDNVVDVGGVGEALRMAKDMVGSEEYVLCFGSLSFLGDIYRTLV